MAKTKKRRAAASPQREIGIGLIGYKFMGRAHSNAYLKAPRCFNLAAVPVLKAVCGRNEPAVRSFARKWGWERAETDYRAMVSKEDIALVDVATPNDSHHQMCMAAIAAGKHVACEKPLALSVAQAHEMACAAKEARILHTVWFNYRRCPAVALARQFVAEGRVGKIYHVRAAFLQDWGVDPRTPLVWRFRKERAGSGAHGDLNAHVIDLARFITGLEFEEVCGMAGTFIKKRPLPPVSEKPRSKSRRKRLGAVTVDDAVLFLARMENDVVADFEATRFASGRKMYNRIEINGSKGSIAWCFERMNELDYYACEGPDASRGFRTILAADASHPYGEGAWARGHVLGYEHSFVNQVADLMNALGKRRKRMWPDFVDGLRCQEVLESVLQSCSKKRWMPVRRHKV